MLIESATTPTISNTGIGQAKLADGLMLVRASMLKMLRLQLAMERRDRRFAIETVDELVAIDRCLSDCLAAIPLASDHAGLAMALDDERTALNREKLTLAAQVITRDQRSEPRAAPASIEPEPVLLEPDPVLLEPQPCDGDAWEETFLDDSPRRHRVLWWIVGLLLVLSAGAAAGFLVGISPEIASLVLNVGGLI